MLTQEELHEVLNNRVTRRAITSNSHLMFFHIYLHKYVRYRIAPFQEEIFRITEDTSNTLACIMSFRGSAKSTLVTFSYAIWSILGVQQKKFVLILCQTQAQARQHMSNLKSELEQNHLLRSDLGPFQEEKESDNQWSMSSLVFANTGARIMIASVDQSIRGIRHHQYRPDLLILDDIEDMNSVKTIEGRQKIYDWFTREVVPLGDFGTRIIMIGNMLHDNCLMMRLKKKIMNKELSGVYRCFPLLNSEGTCAWPGKFDTPEKLEDLHKSVGNELAWRQEYLLQITSDNTRVVHREWLHLYKYSDLSTLTKEIPYKGTFIGVDLAVSQSTYADSTAMVLGKVYGYGNDMRIYILPKPVNEKFDFPSSIERAKLLSSTHSNGKKATLYIENNGFQDWLVQTLLREGYPAVGVRSQGDKRSRFTIISDCIKSGIVLFPEEGCEELIEQMVGFGDENHDDLVDALTIMVSEVMKNNKQVSHWKGSVVPPSNNRPTIF